MSSCVSYVGKWASSRKVDNRQETHAWCAATNAGVGPMTVVQLADVVKAVQAAAASKTHLDDPVIVTLKVLNAAGALR